MKIDRTSESSRVQTERTLTGGELAGDYKLQPARDDDLQCGHDENGAPVSQSLSQTRS